MESRYRAEDAARYVDQYARAWGEDLALRVYTSRLLGADPALVLHGGGNTSVKSRRAELTGEMADVLFVKGSGWDLASIEPAGFPACRLDALSRLAALPALSDEQMVAGLRGQMLDPSSPTPSVEALLHALLPAKFVDHTHADAVLALVDQPDSEALVAEAFGPEALFVPYVMPGFALARAIGDIFRARPDAADPPVMILDKHGIFTWGSTAQESYERMIFMVDRAEREIATRRRRPPTTAPPRLPEHAEEKVLSRLALLTRGALVRASARHWVGTWRTSLPVRTLAGRADVAELTQIGCATPDHVIRTKARPLVAAVDPADDDDALSSALDEALERYAASYDASFERCASTRGVRPKKLDPWPRVVLFPRIGAWTAGRTVADAEVAGDIYEHTATVLEHAAAIGTYRPVSELDLFDVEYWSLEQAKLKKASAPAGGLSGKIAWVSGAARGIGLATARALLSASAHVFLTDRDAEVLGDAGAALEREFPKRVAWAPADVTRPDDVERAMDRAARRFGGLDVVVSNAGSAETGELHLPEGDLALRGSLELNLLGHQNVARHAATRMLLQGTGGVILFNASKSAFNQGPDFGPYAVPKAALVALMRQYAVDLGRHGIRANAVNADRIRTDLFGAGMLEERARARGLSADEYFANNLLKRETLASDVAAAFVYLATAEATTGCVVTVDGGNAAAFPR